MSAKKIMKVGTKAWCWKTGTTVKIDGFKTETIGEREVLKVITDQGVFFYDELTPA